MVDLRITQGRTAFLDLQLQGAKLDQDVRTAVREMAASYRARVVADLRAPKSGRQYGARNARSFYRKQRKTVQLLGGKRGSYMATVRSTKRTRAYTASAPGQAPAVFTGTLARSVRSKVPAKGKGWSARVFASRATAFYRHFLEFGTAPRATKRPARNVGRVAPRPIWSRYQAEIERELPARVLTALDKFQAGS